jgi:hypothetical protein
MIVADAPGSFGNTVRWRSEDLGQLDVLFVVAETGIEAARTTIGSTGVERHAAVTTCACPLLCGGGEATTYAAAFELLVEDELADVGVTLAGEVLGGADGNESDDAIPDDADERCATAVSVGGFSSQPRTVSATAAGSRHGATPMVSRGASSSTP